jgi:hypothetical protein
MHDGSFAPEWTPSRGVLGLEQRHSETRRFQWRKRTLLTAIALVALAAVVAATATAANGRKASKKAGSAVQVEVFAPREGDVAGS